MPVEIGSAIELPAINCRVWLLGISSDVYVTEITSRCVASYKGLNTKKTAPSVGGIISEPSMQKPIGYLRHFDHSTVGESPL